MLEGRRECATTEAERIQLAWQELTDAKSGYDAFIDITTAMREQLREAGIQGGSAVRKLKRQPGSAKDWSALAEGGQASYRQLMDVAIHFVALSSIPVVDILQLRKIGKDDSLLERINAVVQAMDRSIQLL